MHVGNYTKIPIDSGRLVHAQVHASYIHAGLIHIDISGLVSWLLTFSHRTKYRTIAVGDWQILIHSSR
ncbi:hypothetical protein I7I50_05335 [Histoplasma capsulatum G186AR]|uniref:Uncharacterized protein n=1 Tax=Ajellomyces capsulatus TaxID=5037 RepID=A0A8H8D8V7_AJECA|nr:hypothetical protein I7I52_03596 [Histoplasma capsulatum]QSS76016.1 hypothetical protein I7I50_05335 [Histoplasma capsulatum G186AR]